MNPDTQYQTCGPVTGSGGKSRGRQHVPVEASDTLRSRAVARVIDVISEGEIHGLADQAHPLRCVYFDDVPVESDKGVLNFPKIVYGTNVHERYGTRCQDSITGFSEVESEVTLNFQTTVATPSVFTIVDPNVNAIRITFRIPALFKQEDNGDINGSTLEWKIQCQPQGGSFADIPMSGTSPKITRTGKASSPYEYQVRVSLANRGTFPLVFKIVRITEDSTSAKLQNDLYTESYTEIQEVKLTYPDTALIAIEIDSELFGGRVPRRSYRVKGLKVKIPSNYNPVTRVYTGFWDGTFTCAWTNNPAWVLYDVLTNRRYGLGDAITSGQVDKFALYAVAQYCDELVDDGFGGQEPRFVFNGVINDRREAFEVINAIVSSFRGMAFWSAGGVTVTQDAPQDPKRLFSRSNVINGEFTYSGTGLRARHTQALVTWNDPINRYKQEIEVVDDPALIERFGLRPIEVVAFATTSRGQARRLGRWILESEAHETETVTFSGGFECADVRPGDIIQVNDPSRAGVRRGGRVMASQFPSLLGTTSETVSYAPLAAIPVSAGAFVAGSVDRFNTALFQCRILIPGNVQPRGVIFEIGNIAVGTYLGFDTGGNLVLRSGDGSATPSAATSARLVIAAARIPKGIELNLIVLVQPTEPGKVELWINNTYYGEMGTSGGGSFPTNQLATTEPGRYGMSSGLLVGGEDSTAFNGELRSPLKYWRLGQINHVLADEQTIDTRFAPDTDIDVSYGYQPTTINRAANSIIAFAFSIPSGSVPTGCLFEVGNGFCGTYIGFDGNGALIVRAGDGSSTLTSPNLARMVVPLAAIPRDQVVHLMLEITPASGSLRLWLNWALVGEARASAGLPSSTFASSLGGGYGRISTDSTVAAGEVSGYANNFSGTLCSVLSYYEGAQFQPTSRAYAAGSIVLDAPYKAERDDLMHVTLDDGHIDTLRVRATTEDSSTLSVLDLAKRSILPNAMYLLQGESLIPEKWRVISVLEQETHQYQITALKYDSRKYARIEEGLAFDPEPVSLLPSGPALPPRDLGFKESLYKVKSVVQTRLEISWRAAPDPRVTLYRVDALEPNSDGQPGTGNWQVIYIGSALQTQLSPAIAGEWKFKVSSLNGFDQPTSTTSTLPGDYTVVGKTAPPNNVTGFTATRSFTYVQLSWTAVTDLDLLGYEIRRGSSWASGEVVVTNHNSTTCLERFLSTQPVTYWICAVDDRENHADPKRYSPVPVSLTTQAPALSAVTNLAVYQNSTRVRVQFDPLTMPETVLYEIRYGLTTKTWDESQYLTRTTACDISFDLSVPSSTTYRFRVRPCVDLGGTIYYGTETIFDRPLTLPIGATIVKLQHEHSTWPGETVRAPATTATESFAEGATITSSFTHVAGSIGRSKSATFRVSLTVASGTTPQGCIFEVGSSTTGAYLGFNGAGDLIWRAGSGAAPGSAPNAMARVVIPNASIPTNTQFTILCDLRCSTTEAGRVRLWINGRKLAEDSTDDGSAFVSGVWATTSSGQYKGSQASIVAGESGSYSQDPELSSVTLNSNLEYWENVLIDETLEIDGSNQLALKEGATFGAYRYKFNLASTQRVRLNYLATMLFLTANEQDINDLANVEINSMADVPITVLPNAAGYPNIRFLLEFSPEQRFVQSDHEFSSVTVRVEFRRNATDNIRPALSELTTFAFT